MSSRYIRLFEADHTHVSTYRNIMSEDVNRIGLDYGHNYYLSSESLDEMKTQLCRERKIRKNINIDILIPPKVDKDCNYQMNQWYFKFEWSDCPWIYIKRRQFICGIFKIHTLPEEGEILQKKKHYSGMLIRLSYRHLFTRLKEYLEDRGY